MHFIDLAAQQSRIRAQIDHGINDVLSSGQFIMGPQVSELEGKLAEFADARFALACANGTDAILLPLMAWGIGPGDAVFCPSFTYCATAEVVALTGATPVFIDIDRDTYNISPSSLKTAVKKTVADGLLKPRAIIAVDLFGQSADYDELRLVADEFALKLIADSAQGFGTTLRGKSPLHWADVQSTSFYPAKPLGCYGDGGAVLTNDEGLAETMDSLRIHGKGTDKYDNIRVGINSRLDTLQAAILLPKLEIFPEEITLRNEIAERYITELKQYVGSVPTVPEDVLSTWAQFTIEVPEPDSFAAAMRSEGIPTARYYPRPIHLQSAYEHFPRSPDELVNTEDCMTRVISLPMHAYLSEDDQAKVIETTKDVLCRAS